jgi:hypothetical protein
MLATQFAIHWGSRGAPSIGAIHFNPEHAFGEGAAAAGIAIGRRRNSWSRKPETPKFLFGSSVVLVFGT